MRGKAGRQPNLYACQGITPAYAGKSGANSSNRTFTKDHPRLCGEKFCLYDIDGLNPGITPAYAGKSSRFGRCNFFQ